MPMKPNPIVREAAQDIYWPRDLTAGSPDFELQMVLMQITLLRSYLKAGMRSPERERACRTLDFLNLKRRFLERRRVWR